jgi:hypothetical protein
MLDASLAHSAAARPPDVLGRAIPIDENNAIALSKKHVE